MKKQIVFRGIGTALITPFRDGKIDYAVLYTLIDRQIAAGVDALVIGGTTGEAATLTDAERYTLYERAADAAAGRIPLIYGVGTNDTQKTLAHTRFASSLSPAGLLAVTPYYNKGTEEGLYQHYCLVADAAGAPVILYNVPGRTGVDLSLSLIRRLAKHENIVAVKEAGDSADRLAALGAMSDSLRLIAGNDTQIYTVLALGGCGAISVLSNLWPEETVKITDLYREGRHAEARRAQFALLGAAKAMFLETNPAPVKYAMSVAGLCSEQMRLPLAPPTEENRAKIRAALGMD